MVEHRPIVPAGLTRPSSGLCERRHARTRGGAAQVRPRGGRRPHGAATHRAGTDDPADVHVLGAPNRPPPSPPLQPCGGVFDAVALATRRSPPAHHLRRVGLGRTSGKLGDSQWVPARASTPRAPAMANGAATRPRSGRLGDRGRRPGIRRGPEPQDPGQRARHEQVGPDVEAHQRERRAGAGHGPPAARRRGGC